MTDSYKAYFHLPGLYEFYELYKKYLHLFYIHREYFYPWAEIGSIYGAPADCLWAGGRFEDGTIDTGHVLELMERYGISARLTFSNSKLQKEHLVDRKCNKLCKEFSQSKNGKNGIIISSDLLLKYIKKKYPNLYFVSSTTKVITDFNCLVEEINREDFAYVVPDFRLNKQLDKMNQLSQSQKNKVEFLLNECCDVGCKDRKACYENLSARIIAKDVREHICTSLNGTMGYSFARAMESPSFISVENITNTYLPNAYTNFKIEGRGLGSAMVLEFLLYYMVKPNYQIQVREAIYLDSMLDLF